MAAGYCTVAGCWQPVFARGWCRKHYSRARRGRPLQDEKPAVGSPAGHGQYGILTRDEWSVLCHECGGWFSALGQHVRRRHELTADEYREAYGLPRGLGLVALGVSAARSAQARERIGSAGWARFEAARDPAAAAAAREPSDFRAPGALAIHAEQGRDLSAQQRGGGRVKTCLVCGAEYRGPRRTCSAVCASAASSAGARDMDRGVRPATDAEADELRAAHTRGMDDLGQVVRRLQAGGVSSQSIAAAVGRRPSWVSKHWPTRGQ